MHRHCGMSASKARQVLDLIRGEDVAAGRRDPDRHRARGGRGHRQGAAPPPWPTRPHNDQQNPEELYVSACYADEGATMKRWRPRARGPGHPDPQADLPHHRHREPAARPTSSNCAAGAWRRSAPTARAGSTPRGAGPTCPARLSRRRAAQAKAEAERPRPRPRPRTAEEITDQAWTRPQVTDAEPEVTEADTVDGGVDEDEDDGVEDVDGTTKGRPRPTRTRRARTSRWARR